MNVTSPTAFGYGARHLGLGIAALLAGWLVQLLLLRFGTYAFSYLLYRQYLDDTTFQVLLRYVAMPLSTLLPSMIIIQAAHYLSRHTLPQLLYLQWVQPSIVLAALLFLMGGAGEMPLLQLGLLAASGYLPLMFFGARKNKHAKSRGMQ